MFDPCIPGPGTYNIIDSYISKNLGTKFTNEKRDKINLGLELNNIGP